MIFLKKLIVNIRVELSMFKFSHICKCLECAFNSILGFVPFKIKVVVLKLRICLLVVKFLPHEVKL